MTSSDESSRTGTGSAVLNLSDAHAFEATEMPRPVFVVGMNGSGTTMLADCLGRHPDLYMFPHEFRLLPFYLRRDLRADARSREQARALADEIGRSKPLWHVNGRQPFVLQEARLSRTDCASVIDGVFRSFAEREGKRRWGEKSPMNVLHMELIASAYPRAKFVHIVRDGRDAAQSFHRRFGHVPSETVYRWKRVVREGVRQGHSLGMERYLQIRYEDLTQQPERVLRRVCAFLDMPFDERVLQASMRMADPNLLRAGARISHNSGKWSRYFSAAEVRQHEALAGRQLKAMGYPVTTEGDAEPGRLKLAWWRLLGVASRSVMQVRRYGWRSVGAYLRSAAVSLKQGRTGRM